MCSILFTDVFAQITEFLALSFNMNQLTIDIDARSNMNLDSLTIMNLDCYKVIPSAQGSHISSIV